ncbi:hypothetical protein BO78DRAFT_400747 [Aspergillus sclerotiicarbonarius CBS 121057]|uniref:Uncharacterized protein n=1 Tax=Aspergillus sclerotiicarbonarius (strain CBS 121057 / IBT 28362) TaxID=1448318 RepID=A0A319DWK7_ASPSB|nr:hypothetical protein BO78DRAFT_400747 [Aspergillus sclerotiicarbonarius CBS 121057]
MSWTGGDRQMVLMAYASLLCVLNLSGGRWVGLSLACSVVRRTYLTASFLSRVISGSRLNLIKAEECPPST